MYFNEINMAGFKSFADRTQIKFDNGITAIVGPNGCGKSNVADAIRWVLGEQSSKMLRGSCMQDVIFNGTEKRKSLSYSEVTLIFNNSDRFFNFDYDELAVTRKLYRSGESEYQINKNQCRLKDIINIFYDSGIGRDGYSIIGQGKVEEIISSKPENRRAIFEEAAGIAKFKARKIEAERKLERTRENLTRLRDIIGEIERQLGPLKNQAETAKKYLELKGVLKDLEINAYIYQYDHASSSKELINVKLNGLLEQISLRQAELVGLNQKYSDSMEAVNGIDIEIGKLHEEILSLTVGLEKNAGETNLLKERINHLNQQNDKTNLDILNCQNSISKAKNEKEFKETEKVKLEQELKKLENSSGEYSKLVKETADRKFQETVITSQIKENEQEQYSLNTKIQVYENRRRLLSEMQAEYEGYQQAVRKLLKESERNSEIKNKMLGALASLISVPEKFETAVEVALGNAVQNIVTFNEDGAKDLINYLKNNQLGRATFLPVTAMKPHYLNSEDRKVLSEKGVLGVAGELIKFDKRIVNVVLNLLGSTVVVDTLETAVKIAKNTRFSFKIVTLDGDVVNPQGSMTGGSRKSDAVNLISRDREIKTLAEEIEKCKVGLIESQKKHETLVLNQKENIEKLESLEKMKNSTELTEAVRIAEVKSQLFAFENDFRRLEIEISENSNLLGIYKRDLENNVDYITQTDEQIKTKINSAINQESQIKLEQIRNRQNALLSSKSGLQAQLKILDEKKNGTLAELDRLNARKYETDLEMSKVDTDIETMQERIYDEYELTYNTCQEYKRDDFDLDEAMPQINSVRKEIAKLGNVNVNAIEDSKVLYERFETYAVQEADLSKAESDLVAIIADLSKEMSAKFTQEFNKIKENFQITFRELFGGGNAKLELVGSDDMLEAGIEIIAEPPGKKLQNISLLSGGEKALTAIAILFAILRLKPMPFCLLDEIEAALDDANVNRFAQYLRRFSQETQFIVITHRKPTMELADALYGVTMEEKGVSKMVSVKLGEALRNVKAQEELDGAV